MIRLNNYYIQIFTRLVAIMFFSMMAISHVLHFQKFEPKTLWVLEGGLYLGFLLAYLLRKPPLRTAETMKDILLPPVCAVLPFFLMYEIPEFQVMTTLDPEKIFVYSPLKGISWWWMIHPIMVFGTMITLIALLTLRSSFSILTEVRSLVTHGIYRYISHPMYLGEWISAFGSTWLRGGMEKWFFFFLFLVLQWIRLKNEEKKLIQVYPDYQEHRNRCWIYF